MENFLIKYKNKIIGVYNDLEQAKLFINSCISNNLMTDTVDILVYKTNSCYCINTININLKNGIETKTQIIETKTPIIEKKIPIIETKTPVVVKEIDYNDPLFLKLADDKIVLQHKINLLKVQKERITESKEIYDNDIKLYSKFKEILNKDVAFIIPELFKEKFNLFKKLDEENKLNWESFMNKYAHSNIYTDFKLNSYDDSFVNSDNKKKYFNNEIEIESDTESSCE